MRKQTIAILLGRYAMFRQPLRERHLAIALHASGGQFPHEDLLLMTIVIALKVGDGLVLGADSASTLVDATGVYQNSYFNAEKLFNVRKGIPVGALTYGLGGLAGRSVSSLAKDLRAMFSDENQAEWFIDRGTYSVEEIATKMVRFFYDRLFVPQFQADLAHSPFMGFFVAGYSAHAESAEIWQIEISGGKCPGPVRVVTPDAGWGIRWQGEVEALQRLVRGWSLDTHQRLVAAGLSADNAADLLDSVRPMIHPTMPIQDAIDLVHFLIDVTCGFVRFSPGNATVAQPIDSAAITPHEGFRWIRRKHYYSVTLNTPAARELP